MSPNDPAILTPKTLEEATELVGELVGVVKAQSAEIETLRAQVEQLNERAGSSSRNSSRPPSTDSDASRRKRKPRKSSGRSRGGQPGHPKHERALHDEQNLSAPPQSFFPPGECGCGGVVEVESAPACRHQVFDLPIVDPLVHEYRLYAGVCAGCGKRHVPALPQSVPNGQMGPRLLAMIATLSGEFHMTTRKIQRLLAEHYHLEFSLGAISEAQGKMNAAMVEPYQAIGKHLRSQDVVHADETRHFRESRLCWLWVMATAQAVYFVVHLSRGKGAANELIGGFDGVLVTDDFGGYNDVPRHRRQLCWAHLLRHFIGVGERRGNAGAVGRRLELIALMVFRTRHRLDAGTIDEPRYVRRMNRLRQSFIATLQRGSRLRLDGRAKRKCQHLLTRETMCWTHILNPSVPLTNNLAEREIRPYVIWRKLSYAVQSHRGNLFRPMVLSIVQTARAQGVSAYEFLADIADEYQQTGRVMKRLPLHNPALLPAP